MEQKIEHPFREMCRLREDAIHKRIRKIWYNNFIGLYILQQLLYKDKVKLHIDIKGDTSDITTKSKMIKFIFFKRGD